MKKLLAFLCLLSVFAGGCSVTLPDSPAVQEQAGEIMESLAEAAEVISDGSVLEETDASEPSEASDDSEDTGEGDASASDALAEMLPEYAYHYTRLSEEEQALYVDILEALSACASDVHIDLVEEEAFDKVFQCVMNDHPEIFYVDGYTFIKYTKGEEITGNAFSGSYLYDREELAQRNEQIEKKVTEILDGMPTDGGDYEKVKYIYEYLVANTEYVRGADDNQNICSVFLGGESVCQGYAKAAQYLFRKSDIYSVFVSGKVDGGEDHVWNLVRINGAYYHVDITWGDASYVAGEADNGFDGKLPQINYEYLCVPDSQICRTHTIDSIVPIPACDSMEANYYVKEGAYFTEPDMEKVAALFEKAYEDGTAYVTLKCADPEVYAEMERCLIEQQQVFRYLQTSDGTVAYTTNEGQLHLSFWL